MHSVSSWKLLLFLACCVALVWGEGDSGSGDSSCNIGADPLPLSVPSTPPSGGLLLNWLDTAQCEGGCVSGWRYCYYKDANQTQSVPMTFALWRENENRTLNEVEGSRYEVPVTMLPPEQWLICEERELDSGCGVPVEEGDRVGVEIDMASSLHVVGMMEGGEVMVWEGGEEIMSEDSRAVEGHALMVVALVGPCSNGSTPSENCQPPPTEPTSNAKTRLQLWVMLVLGCLGMVVLLLILVTAAFICTSCRRRGSHKKMTPLQTVLLGANGKYTLNATNTIGDSAVDFEKHTLNTSSTHTSSPAPHFDGGVATIQPNGPSRATAPWHPASLDDHTPVASPSCKIPPPVKPKPQHRPSQKTTPPPQCEVTGSTPPLPQLVPVTTPPSGVTEGSSPHRAALCRSYSDQTFKTRYPLGGRPNILLLRSPRHQHVLSRLSTGSLPDFFGGPSMDEDDYALPSRLFSRALTRPQAYLQPQPIYSPIYSYAYTHLSAGQVIPGGGQVVHGGGHVIPGKGQAWVKQRSKSETANPISVCGPHPQATNSDYDDIFLDRYCQDQDKVQDKVQGAAEARAATTSSHGLSQLSPPCLHKASTMPPENVLRSIHPTISHTSSVNYTPSCTPVPEHSRTLSMGSEGYENEDEHPRPPSASQVPESPHTLHHYTSLQPTTREQDHSPYAVPRGSSSSSDIGPSGSLSPQYDRLHTPLSPLLHQTTLV